MRKSTEGSSMRKRGGRNPPTPLSDDPYLNWAVATGFQFARQGAGWVPLLIKLAPGHTVASFGAPEWRSGEPFKSGLLIPSEYTRSTGPASKATFCTALVSINAIAAVISHPAWKAMVGRVQMSQPLSGSSASIPTPTSSPLQPLTFVTGAGPRPTVVAVIDDGIAFANDRFRLSNGTTRVQAYWNQHHSGPISNTANYGRRLTAANINAELANCMHAGIVDEDQVYRQLGIDDFSNDEHKFVARRLAHGTHVLDIAAAVAPNTAAASRPIVAVQLPSRVTADPSGGQLTAYVTHALAYIADSVDQLSPPGAPLPLVINLSYGMTGGPHDGSHLLEEAIDEFVQLRRAQGQWIAVVIPAGNSRQSRGRAILRLKPGGAKQLPWRVQPDDRTISTSEIWLPAGSAVQVQVTSPSGQPTPPSVGVSAGYTYPSPLSANAVCTIDYSAPALKFGRRCVLVHLAPTAPAVPLDPAAILAESGLWQLGILNVGSQPISVDVYVQRDDSPVGYRLLGRQSYFDDAMYRRFDFNGRPVAVDATTNPGRVRRRGTLNAIGTGQEPVIVGSFRASDGDSALYSSLGPAFTVPQGARTPPTPDVASISDDSPVARGVLAAGTRSGAARAMNGTSVAAPQIARWIADQFSAGNQVGRAQVRAFATLVEANLKPPLPPAMHGLVAFAALPADSVGAGRLGQKSPIELRSLIGRNAPLP